MNERASDRHFVELLQTDLQDAIAPGWIAGPPDDDEDDTQALRAGLLYVAADLRKLALLASREKSEELRAISSLIAALATRQSRSL
jgi:hypothetical protein